MEDYYTVKDGDNLLYKITAIEDDYYVLSGVEYRKIRKVHKDLVTKTNKQNIKDCYSDMCIRESKVDIKNKKVILGKVVHFDSDTEYLNKTKKLYDEMGIYNLMILSKEIDIESYIKKLKLSFEPDVFVITGHDSYNKKGLKDINNYTNSSYFMNAVKLIRSKYPNCVIISGACQSNFEALLASGSNFASSPKRINVHIYDPAILAISVCTTSFRKIVNFNQNEKYIKNLKKAFGGIETYGKMKILYM